MELIHDVSCKELKCYCLTAGIILSVPFDDMTSTIWSKYSEYGYDVVNNEASVCAVFCGDSLTKIKSFAVLALEITTTAWDFIH